MDWQQQLQAAYTDPAALLHFLELPEHIPSFSEKARQQFAMKVPQSFVDRIQKGNINDPLLKQILPVNQEEQISPMFENDPLREQQYNPIPGILHKYPSRVLVTLSPSCAINCRYCFRRHFDYSANTPGRKSWSLILDYIKNNTQICEVILSGGDPLIVPDKMLQEFLAGLQEIAHVKLLRIHSRLPIVLPARITSEFLNILTSTRLKPIMVAHCNHPQELNTEVARAIQSLQQKQVTVLNQTVLLRGVNDEVEVLRQLSYKLFDCGILPYYLHILDKVQGTQHFDLPLATAKTLYAGLIESLPGYLVPRLVQEIPGTFSKQAISIS